MTFRNHIIPSDHLSADHPLIGRWQRVDTFDVELCRVTATTVYEFRTDGSATYSYTDTSESENVCEHFVYKLAADALWMVTDGVGQPEVITCQIDGDTLVLDTDEVYTRV